MENNEDGEVRNGNEEIDRERERRETGERRRK